MSEPAAHEDFVDLVVCLNAEGCDYLVVGAHALAAHGSPRATGDLDILIRPERANAERVVRALARFGAPLAAHGVGVDDFVRAGTVYQIGLPPRRIDLLTEVSGLAYDEAAEDPLPGHLGDAPVRYLGLAAMLVNKRASGRPKDLADAAVLEELLARRRAEPA